MYMFILIRVHACVTQGEKIFYFIPPTEENLLKYEQWVMSSNQSEIFFGDKVPKCYKCHVSAGNTLFIPTGECVHTPAHMYMNTLVHVAQVVEIYHGAHFSLGMCCIV